MAKTVLITGATSGIGKAAALQLAKQGYQVIIHGRNAKKTEAARQEIITASGHEHVSATTADLYSLSDVRRMCAEIQAQVSGLDILINNAGGLMGKEREITQEGFEKTFAVNVLAPFLITQLLMGLLIKSDDARIINVASNSHQLNAKPAFDDVQLKKQYNPLRSYGNAKLFLIWNTQHLAALLEKDGITNVRAYTMHPGAVATSFGVGSDLGPVLNFVSKLARFFFRSPEAGADTIVYLATEKNVPGKSGDYFVDRKPAKKSTRYFTPQREQLIWNYCLGQIDTIGSHRQSFL
ncbi:SDR family NAD(P)-dependent oxidoreductase [Chitinophaga filiformis]|uniref:NAD(P)-dependent dehydrogenase, short-chain alcohol dehydrogenase family n=1 Tax=Chitinophaga filiformis TaxID=104663 RepID=A0A1G7P027_CHIFI|nr:SDR family NAD(P)-dependent oxidoreductase [Chitinophaga filiformis]SDF79584.1 NAD(P)-dependent dehydrogenase, short-chain alcohol dehydrogenase family [Chitinophaga filiformis]